MFDTKILALNDARKIIDMAKREAEKNGWAMCIAVCDAGGHNIILERMDGAPLLTAQIAPAKANASVTGGRPSQAFEEMINRGRIAILAMPILPMSGGVPIVVDERIVGAVGVSGGKPTEDVHIAKVGISALMKIHEISAS